MHHPWFIHVLSSCLVLVIWPPVSLALHYHWPHYSSTPSSGHSPVLLQLFKMPQVNFWFGLLRSCLRWWNTTFSRMKMCWTSLRHLQRRSISASTAEHLGFNRRASSHRLIFKSHSASGTTPADTLLTDFTADLLYFHRNLRFIR